MKNWWQTLDIGSKLNIPIQVLLLLALSFAHIWIMAHIKEEILDGAERRATVSADGIINGMNMMMLNGTISDPNQRLLFINKMSDTENVKEVRIIRTRQVQDQFGYGLPEEQVRDEMDKRVISSKKTDFLLNEDPIAPTLRTVVPFIASSNFRGTNCLTCHKVEAGSVNGAASITIDMTDDFKAIRRTQGMLWLGQILLQLLLFFATSRLISHVIKPILQLQSSMESMQRCGSMASFVPLPLDERNQDEIGKLARTFNQMSESLYNSEKSMRLASSIYQSNADAIVVTDENNLIVDVNPAFTRITGYTLDEVRGKNPRLMQSGQHDIQFYRKMWRAIIDQGHWQGEIWDKRRDGGLYAKSVNIIALRHQDGSIYRFVAQFSDITEKKQKDELIHWQANYDPLTNLPNRRLFQDRLNQAIKLAHRTELPLALFFIDLDYFKEINDTLGHANGDVLLMEVARRISSCVREADTVARLGGDEFTVILPELSDATQILRVAKNIVDKLSQPFFFVNDETGYHVSASIGIANYPQDAMDTKGLIKCADKAMYAAKSEGRNRFVYFSNSGQ
ncbi:diguanylate cyclase domain-containing protein [Gallionella capsiferriformans]|uniref:Diguanylate cyclase with PAS/PAC sensor n=1 Tax=Gallionella capsiferriformans (strain ES-2) TaxID=395494 RepID=D9SGS5_GALCS|nr:diguanylate cyclase [Gallionella capsiferriformans]ADL55722.1 diguanylate cyclase with PAS/PAC sensor [Gallionella capsiferriformans ES-2]